MELKKLIPENLVSEAVLMEFNPRLHLESKVFGVRVGKTLSAGQYLALQGILGSSGLGDQHLDAVLALSDPGDIVSGCNRVRAYLDGLDDARPGDDNSLSETDKLDSLAQYIKTQWSVKELEDALAEQKKAPESAADEEEDESNNMVLDVTATDVRNILTAAVRLRNSYAANTDSWREVDALISKIKLQTGEA